MQLDNENRQKMIEALKQELVGPDPRGIALDTSSVINFEVKEDAYGPFFDEISKEEIIRVIPTVRYGIGVLYPAGVDANESEDDSVEISEGLVEQKMPKESTSEDKSFKKMLQRNKNDYSDIQDSNDDFDLGNTNNFKPSALGMTFFSELSSDGYLHIDVKGSFYKKVMYKIKGKDQSFPFWLRVPVHLEAKVKCSLLKNLNGQYIIKSSDIITKSINHLNLRIEIFSREFSLDSSRHRALTLCVVNRVQCSSQAVVENCLFQSELKVKYIESSSLFVRSPEKKNSKINLEDKCTEMLFDSFKTFAVGHGCAANWRNLSDDKIEIYSESLPMHQAPSVTADITFEGKEDLKFSMKHFSDSSQGPSDAYLLPLTELVSEYKAWIKKQRIKQKKLKDSFQDSADEHLKNCEDMSERMERGIVFLKENPKAFKAFCLANEAILIQQISNADPSPRKIISYDDHGNKIFSDKDQFRGVSINSVPKDKGNWRAFQMGFLLTSIESTANYESIDREIVELIWFPTGGGKTEAYLGTAAFALFYRRLEDPSHSGTDVIMRYTLRLLTAQQFQRASSLVTAMEIIRRREYQNVKKLGETIFSIGLWLGGTSTPNKRRNAISQLRKLKRNDGKNENNFMVNRCPYCRCEMGLIKTKTVSTKPQGKTIYHTNVEGYFDVDGTIKFKCPEEKCPFSNEEGLPVFVIDEDIYEYTPSIILGTVDKFAQLAWVPKSNSMFGLDCDGKRINKPPSIIIQDELHLIAGPLGSVVGLYEVIIENLCSFELNGKLIKPKIICSTATIRRYQEQILGLYGRNTAKLFPPPGLDISDSFFGKYEVDENGNLKPGRLYLGVFATSLGSIQTAIVRTFSSLLQAGKTLPEKERNHWWSLLVFFNSLRELGTSLSLLQSDIPGYLLSQGNRKGLENEVRRWLTSNKVIELTGRLPSEEIPQQLSLLEQNYDPDKKNGGYPVDVCLASSIIEVGVDVPRLALMSVIGQPKTTAQYIQVTGRVGRNYKVAPGLVVTIYNCSKSRDRSHFEKFRNYHEKLYSQVEPSSVTPFSPKVLERALAAIMVINYRMKSGINSLPIPFPEESINETWSIIKERVDAIEKVHKNSINLVFLKEIFEDIKGQWKEEFATIWDTQNYDGETPLMARAGSYVPLDRVRKVWKIPNSMRSVDAECQIEITRLFSNEEDQEI